ncbi:MAG: hypothetical protein J0M29_12165 [Chitinophagales bacterium]|nr:hypothetical protein [Chitinophagales bacterium]
MFKRWFDRFVGLFDPAGVKKYITQVTLILVSLFIATRADRCREAAKDQVKLKEYLTAVQQDLETELESDAMNLNDCERDVQCLVRFLQLSEYESRDSLFNAFSNFAEVYQRGVFRAFPPSTYDIMVQTGDVSLIKDLKLRNTLASVFAFRQNVIQKDLHDFDQQTQICAEKLGRYLDLGQMFSESNRPFLLDEKGFRNDPHNEVFVLLRVANLRGFHLDVASDDLKEAKKALDEYLKKI